MHLLQNSRRATVSRNGAYVAIFVSLAVAATCGVRAAHAAEGSSLELALVPLEASNTSSLWTIRDGVLLVEPGPSRVSAEFRLSNWDPDMGGTPLLASFQITLDGATFTSGSSGMLSPAAQTCGTPTDCFNSPGFSFGSDCVSGMCLAGYIDTVRDEWVFHGIQSFPLVDVTSIYYRYAGTTFTDPPSGVADTGADGYVGTLVLDVSADASGTFVVGPQRGVAGGTYVQDVDGVDIPIATYTDWTIQIADLTGCCLPGGVCEILTPDECAAESGVEVADCDEDSCAGVIPAGEDCWDVGDCSTSHITLEGSLEVNGFQGDVLMSGTMRTQRQISAALEIGESADVPVEVVSLQLRSCELVGTPPRRVWVTLAAGPQTPTKMHITRSVPNGGTYLLDGLFINARVTAIDETDSEPTEVISSSLPIALLNLGGGGNWSRSIFGTSIAEGCNDGFIPSLDAPGADCAKRSRLVDSGSLAADLYAQPSNVPLCPYGACCADEMCVEVEGLVDVSEAIGQCKSLGGTFIGAGLDCSDLDEDGIPDAIELACDNCPGETLCTSDTEPTQNDSDGDGCIDSADPNPQDICIFDQICRVLMEDCNANGVEDVCDILSGEWEDCDANGVIDVCEPGVCYAIAAAAINGVTSCDESTLLEDCDVETSLFRGPCVDCPPQEVELVGGDSFDTPECVSCWSQPIQPPVDPGDTGGRVASAGCSLIDPWITPQAAGPIVNFIADPFPAEFFGPGSLPFDGAVPLRGEPLGMTPYGLYGDADTLHLRSADPFDRCDVNSIPLGTAQTVDIELVALSLQSIVPITVNYDGGGSELWHMFIDLSPTAAAPMGSLTATKTNPNGGTYLSTINLQPRYTLVLDTDPNTVRVLDTGDPGTFRNAITLQTSTPKRWVHDVDPSVGILVNECTTFHPAIGEIDLSAELDCNGNGARDDCDVETGASQDCNGNGLPDECDVAATDCNGNGTPDDCEADCDGNGTPDDCDLAGGAPDCDSNGVVDACDPDCNLNGSPDACDIDSGASEDCNGNGLPDDCEVDCDGNGVPDDCDIDLFGSPDCQGNRLPDECDLAFSLALDCNSNAVPDSCDIAAGAGDTDANGVPDSCECFGTNAPVKAYADKQGRYLTIAPQDGTEPIALRVTLTSLHHPDPQPMGTPDFSAFEGEFRWVGPPVATPEGAMPEPTFFAAQLQCEPYFTDWSAFGQISVFGTEIMPSSTLTVQAVHETCASTLESEASYSLNLDVATARWGDMVEPFKPESEFPQPDVLDILAVVDKFLGLSGALPKASTQLNNNLLVPDEKVDLDDILLCVDSFLGQPYPYAGPSACP